MHVSMYQSIEMNCVVLSVKFVGGFFISILRNKQLFTKKLGAQNQSVFKKLKFSKYPNPAIWKKNRAIPLEKVPFSCERDRQPIWKFNMATYIFSIYPLVLRKLGILGRIVFRNHSNQSLFWGLLVAFTGSYDNKGACF
jgi:hypothetical protein